MFEVLLFSFSISIDAFGYSIGFGSRNIKVSKFDFLILNLINTLILTLFFLIYSSIQQVINRFTFLSKVTAILLFCFGCYYLIQAFVSVIKSMLSNKSETKLENILQRQIKYFNFYDFLILLAVFVFENAFSTFIFFSHFSNHVLFIASNFVFHFLFFVIGFDLGNKIVKKISVNTPVITGVIFVILSIMEYFG